MSFQAITNEHIKAANKIMESFQVGNWTILIAQMQSGKTFTFLLVCSEMMRLNLIESVIIFSGNAETDLRDQLKAKVTGKDKEFEKAYRKFLRNKLREENFDGDEADESERIMENVLAKITVIWGTELNKYKEHPENSLFIWEESHFAQSLNQCPDKFLRRVGISADGDSAYLHAKNNFVLSVSATPFSEESDNIHKKQNKGVVYLKPGNNYNSIKMIRDCKRLKTFTSVDTGLTTALNTPHTSPKYALVRISKKNENKVVSIINACGWAFVVFDSLEKSDEDANRAIEVWKNMGTAPVRDTVILIRQKCRMGKNLNKQHVLFVMETAKSSNTDTVLQSLLGRVCGYSVGSDQIDVYLHQKIVNSGEIDTYIRLIENLNETDKVVVLPKKAHNIKSTITFKSMYPIIPFVVTNIDVSDINSRRSIPDQIKDVINQDNYDFGKTQYSQFQEIRSKLNSYCDTSNHRNTVEIEFEIHNVSDNQTKRFTPISDAVKRYATTDAIMPESLWTTGVTKGERKEGRIVHLFCYKNDDIRFGIHAGSVVVYGVTQCPNDYYTEFTSIPTATGHEVFAHNLEDGTVVESNGGFAIGLPLESCNKIEIMMEYILDFVDISMKYVNSRSVSSQWDEKDKEYKGILLLSHVEKSMLSGGSIYNAVAEKGFELKLTPSSTRPPKKISAGGIKKFASISW
jgi:hypothetical protein